MNTISRAIVYQGRTFAVNQTVASSATLDYFFAGYQYDLVSNRMGHFGVSVGGAYLNASGSLTTQVTSGGTTSAVSAARTETFGLPLAGMDFRIFPWRHHRIFEVEGAVRGMSLGDYGYYVQAIGQGGVSFGPFTLLAGYRAVNTSIHESSSGGNTNGITARLQGPIFSGAFRW